MGSSFFGLLHAESSLSGPLLSLSHAQAHELSHALPELTAVLSCLLVFSLGLMLVLGVQSMGFLRDAPRFQPKPVSGRRRGGRHDGEGAASTSFPVVSIVVAACNEERDIEAAMDSLLAQDYPALEVVAVNDRSTDATPELLERLALRDGRVRTLHVKRLPPGWLGKNHAMYLGATLARGDYLLFTDADVVLEPTAISRAVGLMERDALDHLTVFPHLRMKGRVLQAWSLTFAAFFLVFTRPWRARIPGARESAGIGAFNLVRRGVYRRIGGHRRFALAVVDDFKLGQIIKQAGYRQLALAGVGMVSLEWYASVGEVIRGMRKNLYAAMDFNPLKVVGAGALVILCGLAPFAGAVLAHGLGRALFVFSVLFYVWMYGQVVGYRKLRLHVIWGFPVGSALFLYAMVNSCLFTLRRGGVEWRGTFYALEDLRGDQGAKAEGTRLALGAQNVSGTRSVANGQRN